ncbi:hypothetical protein [Krasilnikovia sp. M28-CT-15]|uniref:hypothetical protein n=1 Tax=Krasilnikovia sp. M28-CT-15 TaxID=3373540 RepID=UPI0038763054
MGDGSIQVALIACVVVAGLISRLVDPMIRAARSRGLLFATVIEKAPASSTASP